MEDIAVGDPRDSVSRHVEDTMSAGCFLNDREAVEIMCREGPHAVVLVGVGQPELAHHVQHELALVLVSNSPALVLPGLGG